MPALFNRNEIKIGKPLSLKIHQMVLALKLKNQRSICVSNLTELKFYHLQSMFNCGCSNDHLFLLLRVPIDICLDWVILSSGFQDSKLLCTMRGPNKTRFCIKPRKHERTKTQKVFFLNRLFLGFVLIFIARGDGVSSHGVKYEE